MRYSTVDILTCRYHCFKCGDNLDWSVIRWMDIAAYGDAEEYRKWARELGCPIHEEVESHDGLCDKCYDGSCDDEIKLINRLEVYARNIRNIEDENYRQDGSMEKHIRYHCLIRQEITQWETRTVYQPIKLYFLVERTFYVKKYFTRDGLEAHVETWMNG